MSIRIVGIGGSLERASQSERALLAVLGAGARRGADTVAFTGAELDMPAYTPGAGLPPAAAALIRSLHGADAVVISSPGYHGTVSGLVKNCLDYLEELRDDERPYLDGRAVGLIAVARGWQATVGTLATLRQLTHALRGWPTPIGLAVNRSVTSFDEHGATQDAGVSRAVDVMAAQLVDFASRFGQGAREPGRCHAAR